MMRATIRVLVSVVLLAVLAACGGGDPEDQPADGCATAADVRLPGAGNVLALQVVNPDATPRLFTLTGRVAFSATASGAEGGYSSLVLTNGQSPVGVATIRAPAGGAAAATDLAFSTDVVVPAGTTQTWMLANAPLPAPYGWSAMRFASAEVCAR